MRIAGLAGLVATAELAELQPKLEQKHKINKLRKLLEDLSEDYERIYLDTPPALNFYTVSALIAADRVLIPFDCDSFSRNALYGLAAGLVLGVAVAFLRRVIDVNVRTTKDAQEAAGAGLDFVQGAKGVDGGAVLMRGAYAA